MNNKQKPLKTERGMAVLVGGVYHPSISEAGRFFKMHPGSLKKRIKSLSSPDCKYVDDINLEKTLIKKVNSVQVKIEGILFTSFAEAARFYGIPRRTVRYRCLSQSFWFGNSEILTP